MLKWKCCLASLVLGGAMAVAQAADLHRGVEAYERADYAAARKEWVPLAKQGDAAAQYKLGLIYGKGQGVPQDPVTGYAWIDVAAIQGYQDAHKLREMVVKLMRRADIEQGQRLAAEYYQKYVVPFQ